MLKQLDKNTTGCMDEYSFIPDSVINDQVDKPVRDGRTASSLMAVFATTVVVKIILIVFVGLCIMCLNNKAKQQSNSRK